MPIRCPIVIVLELSDTPICFHIAQTISSPPLAGRALRAAWLYGFHSLRETVYPSR